ncbi:hypothetical protein AZE42_12374, partial [Rhizopogon vesiculosus]
TQSRLGALYEARENEAFVSTFDAVFSPSCEVRVNHTPSTVDAFKEGVLSHRSADAGSSVVAGTLIVSRNMNFRIRAAPAQRQTHINFSARVEQDPSIQADEHDDHRRITSFYHTSVDKTPPIHLATPHAATHGKED